MSKVGSMFACGGDVAGLSEYSAVGRCGVACFVNIYIVRLLSTLWISCGMMLLVRRFDEANFLMSFWTLAQSG